MEEFVVTTIVALAFSCFGIGIIYMVIQDLGIQSECEGFIALVDGGIRLLKLLINPLSCFYTNRDKKHEAYHTCYNSNADTHPYKLLSKGRSQLQDHEHAYYYPSKIKQPRQDSCGFPEFYNAADKQSTKCDKDNQLYYYRRQEQEGNKDKSKPNQKVYHLLTHIKFYSISKAVNAIIKRLKKLCQLQANRT